VTEKREEGIILNVEVTMKYGFNLVDPLMQAIKNIKNQVEYMTALNVLEVNIHVKNLYVTKNK
jgi:uncharacterized alkaline shock family protein YloU